jgi:hypothetical protein
VRYFAPFVAIVLLVVTAVAFLMWDRSADDDGVSSADAERCAALAEEAENGPLAEVAEMFCRSSFKATYNWGVFQDEIPGDGFPVPTRVTLYKVGLQQLRIDADVEHENDGARIVVIGRETSSEDKPDIVVCSYGGALPGTPSQGEFCFREEEGDSFGGVFLYSIPGWLFGGSGSVGDLARADARTVAGETGDCFVNTDVEAVETEFCYSKAGVPLFSRIGEHLIEAVEITDDVGEADFTPPLAITERPPFEGPEPTPVPPDEQLEVHIAVAGNMSQGELDAAANILRRRIDTVDPACVEDRAALAPGGPAQQFVSNCVVVEGGQVVLRFETSGYADRWTDAELTDWLTATGNAADTHLRFCEPLLDGGGNVAVVADGEVAYAPGTCEAELQGDQVRVRDANGGLSLADISYLDRLEADPDDVVWTPAIGDLNGEQVAFTDEHLLSAYFDHPANFTHRFFYKPSPEGEQILQSIFARLGPTPERRLRTSDDHYSLALFVDGAPLRDLDGDLALVRVDSTDWAPWGISNLSRADAQRVTQLIVGPELQTDLDVISITRSAPPE